MGKTIKLLLGIAVVGGVGFSYRHEIAPYIPPSVLAQLNQLASDYLPAQLLSALAAPDRGNSQRGAANTKRSAEAGSGESGEAKGGKQQAGGGKAGDGKAAGGKGGAPAAPVTVAVGQTAEMPVILSSPGTVEAMATVNLKPRVDGQVVEVGFKEGDLVEEGTVLYRLDDRLVLAQIKQAEANVARDRASLKDAESILDRKEVLLRNKYASEAQTETARQQVEVLKASIAAGVATVDAQKTQLDYLTIRAPITGRIGSITAKLGSFIRSADLAPLLTINQTKPIAVTFALPQINLEPLKQGFARKSRAVITVPGMTPLKVTGVLNFVDNQVDKTTGTVTGKVMVENAEETLWPGQAVGVDLTIEIKQNLIAVPASAVLPAQQGMIVWLVGADNTVSIRTVKQERVIDQIAYLTDGIKAGDRVVTDGQLRLAPGGRVAIRETTSVPEAALKIEQPALPGKVLPEVQAAPGKSGQISAPVGEEKVPETDAASTVRRQSKRG